MFTIKESARSGKHITKKSIFITTIYKIASKEEAEERLGKTMEEFKKASHNAYAYRVGNPVTWEESSDDGEVKGCAGRPVMDILQRKDLTNILVIVTRFYGGVKLGPAGLIKAYANSALSLIDVVGIKKIS